MAKPRVYVETSIPSFYYEVRSEPEMVARRTWTREWWDGHGHGYDRVTSEAVLDELAFGRYPGNEDALSLLRGIPLLAAEPAIAEIVRTYVNHSLMPRDPGGDALHLALASYHKCEFLLTWNCTHLANARKFRHIQRVNTLLGLYVPSLVTPLELLSGEEDPQ